MLVFYQAEFLNTFTMKFVLSNVKGELSLNRKVKMIREDLFS